MSVSLRRPSDPFDALSTLVALDLSEEGHRARALAVLKALFQATCGGFYLSDASGTPAHYVLDGLDPGLLELYQGTYRKEDPLDPERYFYSPWPRVIRLVDVVVSMQEFESTRYYREFLRLCNMYHEIDAYLAWNGHLLGGFFLARPKSHPPFSVDDLRLLAKMAEPLATHLSRCRLLSQIHEKSLTFRQFLEALLPQGSFILDADLVCRYADGTAMCRLSLGEGDRWSHPLLSLLRDRLDEAPVAHSDFTINNMRIHLTGKKLTGGEMLVLGNVGEGQRNRQSPLASIARRLRLTSREAEIALKVALGASNSQIAADLSLSELTVKTHLKNIFRKAGIRSRTELAALVWRCSESSGFDPKELAARHSMAMVSNGN